MGNIKTKKVFQIQINGITESTDAVKTLDDALDKLEQRIDRLSKAEIKVKVSGGDIDTAKTKVSGGSSGSSTPQEDKLALEIEKEKTKQVQLTNEALREQVLEKERLKQANKEELDAIKQQAKGYYEIVDGVKVYDDSLNGMRAQLKDMKQELANMSTSDGSAWEAQAQKVNDLNQQIKDLEEQYGVFSRNVGDYYNKVKQALEDWDMDREFNVDFNITGAEGSINDLKQQLKELKTYFNDLAPDDANFDKTAQAIKSLNNQITDMESKLKDVGAEANSVFTGRFTTTIGGVEASFSNASEACEALRKKLVAMRVAGEENTPMYTEIIELVRRLSKEAQIANQQVAGMTKITQNMGKVISVMRGFSGLAALGQGIAGFFGDGSKEMEKFIKNFAQITMVIAGLKELQELVESGDGAWGKFAQSADKAMDKLLSPMTSLKDATAAAREYVKANEELNKVKVDFSLSEQELQRITFMQALNENLYEQIQVSQQAIESVAGMSDEWQRLEEVLQGDDGSVEYLWEKIGPAMNDLKAKFPELTSEVDKYVNTTRQIDHTNEEAVRSLQEYQEAQEKVNKAQEEQDKVLGKLHPKLQSMAKTLGNMGVMGRVAATSLYGVATALKAVGKALIVVAVLQVLAEVIDWLTEGFKKGYGYMQNWFGYLNEADAKKLTDQLEGLNKQLDALNRNVDIQVKIGNLGEVEGEMEKLKNSLTVATQTRQTLFDQEQIREWINELKNVPVEDFDELSEAEKNAATYLQNISNISDDFFENLKNNTPEERVKLLADALGLTEDQLASAMSVLQGSDGTLESFLDHLSDIDWDLNDIGVDGVKAFLKLGNAVDNVRTQSAQLSAQVQSDIDRLNSQNITITASLDPTNFNKQWAVIQNQLDSAASAYGLKWGSGGKLYRKGGGEMTAEQKMYAEAAEKNRKLQEEQARKQAADRARQQRTQALRDAKQRNNQAKQAAKQAAKAAQDAQNRANEARIAAMKEGRAKELAEENERFRQLKQGNKVSQAEVELHNKKIADINAEWDKKEQDAAKEHADKIYEIQKNMFADLEDLRREKEDLINDSDMGKAENAMRRGKNDTSFDADNATLQDREKYYDDLLALDEEYLAEKARIEKLAAQQDRNRRLNDAQADFNEHLRQNQEDLKADLEAVDERVKEGIIKEEQGNIEKEALRKTYTEHEAEIEKAHKAVLAEIEAQTAEEITKIQLDALQDRQDAVSATFTAQIAEIQAFYSDIDSIMEANTKKHTNQFGLINFSYFRDNIKQGLQSAELAKKEFEKKKKELQDALNQKKISFDDFKQMNKELDDALRDVEGKVKEMKNNLSMAFNDWLSSSMESIMQYTDVMQSMWQTFSSIQTMKLDEQSKELEARQKLLDEELKMIEDNYTKQEEITRKHKEKVDSLEDELADSRGDRRQALIDALAEERRQQEKSIEEEKKLTKEKKANAAKQEQIKKQQDALEKKRREQEKRNSIIDATISTFAAVANALALKPFYVGLAMSAVASALGMAQVAAISSQKYADGGLLNGKPHSQGGIPVGMTGIEVEGGEYVTNKASTRANLPLLEYINSNRRTITKEDLIRFYDDGGGNTLVNQAMTRRFADGGIMPSVTDINVRDMINYQQAQDDRPVVVSVVDINDRMENLRQVEVLAGMR